MLTERRDYLLRLIQQAGAAASRLRELLTGEAAPAQDVAREADHAIGALLGGGSQAQLLERLDADSAVRLTGDVERVWLWVELLRLQGDALSKSGAEDAAQRLRTRAAEIETASVRLAGSLGP